MDGTAACAQLWSTSIGKAGWRALAASWLGWMFDGYETYAIVLVMGQAVGELLPPEKHATLSLYMGGLLAATLLGWATGGVSAGVLTDYIGRKRMLMISILWYAAFAGLTAVSPNYWFLLVFLFLTGLGLGAEWGTWDRYRRGILAAFAPWTNWGCTSCRPRGRFFPRVWYLVFRESARLFKLALHVCYRNPTRLLITIYSPSGTRPRLVRRCCQPSA
jgi:hypothetical protein